jgi:hypothetical protein
MADIWTEFESDSWSSSILDDSVFKDLYEATTDRISDVLKVSGYDCVVDVGCGTGDIIGNLEGTGNLGMLT